MARKHKLAPVERFTQEKLIRADGWYSTLTGVGTVAWDKRQSSEFQAHILTDVEAKELWRGDDIAARIIELIPKEMFRKSFELKISDDKELAEDVCANMEELGFDAIYARAKSYERAYGGGAIFPVINDGSPNLALPLNEDRVTKIDQLLLLEPRELHPVRYYTDHRSGNKLGLPEIFEVRPLNTAGGPTTSEHFYIHESRLIIFGGIRVSRAQAPGVLNGWGDSVLTRSAAVLRDFNMTWSSAAILMHDFGQAVFRMKGLAELIGMNRDDVVKMRMQAVELSRSVARALLIDSEEEFERKQTPISGLAEFMDRFGTRLSASCGIPVTLLMGQSPAGLQATGASDIRFFYDSVAAEQKTNDPQVEKGVRLFLRQIQGPTKGKEPKTWSHQWRKLWEQTDQEVAAARATQAGTDKIYIETGVLSPEEVALSRFGGDTYSFETHVDFKAREAMEPVAAPPAKTEQQIEEEEAQKEAQAQQLAAMNGKKPPPDDEGGGTPDDGGKPTPPKKPPGARTDAYNPDQPRAENGQFGEGSGGGAKLSKDPGRAKKYAARMAQSQEFYRGTLQWHGRQEIKKLNVSNPSQVETRAAEIFGPGGEIDRELAKEADRERAEIAKLERAHDRGLVAKIPTQKLNEFRKVAEAHSKEVQRAHVEVDRTQLEYLEAVAQAEAISSLIQEESDLGEVDAGQLGETSGQLAVSARGLLRGSALEERTERDEGLQESVMDRYATSSDDEETPSHVPEDLEQLNELGLGNDDPEYYDAEELAQRAAQRGPLAAKAQGLYRERLATVLQKAEAMQQAQEKALEVMRNMERAVERAKENARKEAPDEDDDLEVFESVLGVRPDAEDDAREWDADAKAVAAVGSDTRHFFDDLFSTGADDAIDMLKDRVKETKAVVKSVSKVLNPKSTKRVDWDPDQPRAENGQFGEGSGGAKVKDKAALKGKSNGTLARDYERLAKEQGPSADNKWKGSKEFQAVAKELKARGLGTTDKVAAAARAHQIAGGDKEFEKTINEAMKMAEEEGDDGVDPADKQPAGKAGSLANIAREHGMDPKRARAILRKAGVGKDAHPDRIKEILTGKQKSETPKAIEKAVKEHRDVQLPPPPPMPDHVVAERADNIKGSLATIDESRKEWQDHLDTKAARAKWLTSSAATKIPEGMTESKASFYKAREEFAEKLNERQLDAALWYSHTGDQVMNSALRHGIKDKDPEVQAKIRDLTDAINSNPLDRDVVVSRGMTGKWATAFVQGINEGDTFSEPGFSSTAITPTDMNVSMSIRLPKGTKAAPIPTRYSAEGEYLLAPGTRFKVIGKSQTKDRLGNTQHRLELEVVND